MVIDALGNHTTADYDTFGRAVQIANPDAGTTEWSYDRSGNLAAKQTARLRAQIARYAHHLRLRIQSTAQDRLSRRNRRRIRSMARTTRRGTQTAISPGASPEERSEAGTKTFRYDRLGNIAREVNSIISINEPFGAPYNYEMSYTHDSFGRTLSVKFPGNGAELVQYKYDHGGRIKRIFGDYTVIDPKNKQPIHTEYLAHMGYDQFDQKRRMVSGNAIETNYSYDPVMRRLEQRVRPRAGTRSWPRRTSRPEPSKI